jgi:hypothetical protein
MSREMDLLEKTLKFMEPHMWASSTQKECIKLKDEIRELLAQPEQTEQEPEAWIVVNKETGYRTQVSDLTPFLYNREIFEVIPLYTAPPKREPLGDGITADMYRANKKATHPDSYWAGVNDAEKAHGIGVDDD